MKADQKKNTTVHIFKDIDALSAFVVAKWLEISKDAIKKKGQFNVAVSGGKTPEGVYNILGNSKPKLPWDRTRIFWVDERFVPFGSPDSNYNMIKRSLLDKLSLPAGNAHPINIEKTPQDSAERYEKDIKKAFSLNEGRLPEFDLIMLGIGGDGHTASLFAGDEALSESRRLAVPVRAYAPRGERITLTLPVINNAKNIIFLVTGPEKSGITKGVLEGKNTELPASLVKPEHGEIFFMLDTSAASLLKTSPERGDRL